VEAEGSILPVYQLMITLAGVHPPIWRRVHVRQDTTLYTLHQIIQAVMPWEDVHVHEFSVGSIQYGSPDPEWPSLQIESDVYVQLGDLGLTAGSTFGYLYDPGDNWQHLLLVEQLLEPEPGVRYPVCTSGRRSAPPEDTGGAWRYLQLLTALGEDDSEHYSEATELLGDRPDPDYFDMALANQRLRALSQPLL
jgi:hypothetical protein